MSNAVTTNPMSRALGAPSSKFAAVKVEDLGAGISSGFGVVGYKGKIWSIKAGGTEHKMLRPDDGTPAASIELVILRASEHVSKVYYKSSFVDGSNAKPDCQSVNGIKPDKTIPNPVNPQCADCPMNQWGSRISDDGKPGKACQDVKRLAVVPQGNIRNDALGGPLLLRIPPASLKELKAYADQLMGHGFPYFGVATRILFDMEKAYPRFIFSAIRALTDAEADDVIEMRDDPRTKRITDEAVEFLDGPADAPAEQAPPVAKGIFEQPPGAPPVTQQVVQPAPQQAATQSPVQAPVEAPATPAPARRKKAAQTPSEPQQAAPQQATLPLHDPETGEIDEEAELMAKLAAAKARKAAAAAQAAAPAPAPAPVKQKAAPPPPPVAEDEDEGEEDDDFENMLDNLVNS